MFYGVIMNMLLNDKDKDKEKKEFLILGLVVGVGAIIAILFGTVHFCVSNKS